MCIGVSGISGALIWVACIPLREVSTSLPSLQRGESTGVLGLAAENSVCIALLHVFSCNTLNVVVKPLDNQIGCQMSVERVFGGAQSSLLPRSKRQGREMSGGSVLTAESVSVQNVVRQGFPPSNLQVVPSCLSASLVGGTGAHS